jgi:ubiquinone biosynthesis protein
MRIVRPVMATVGGLSHTVRDISRMREVATILVRHGMGFWVSHINIPGFRKGWAREPNADPERVVKAIQELGPTFIKLGQVLSTRPDVIPQEYVEALQKLQDNASPLAFKDLDARMVEGLGADWRSQLADFDETPLASASIAQVHRATLKGGQKVVFKIQRPRIEKTVLADLSILQFLVNRLLVEYPECKYFDPLGVLEEFEQAISSEMDFLNEAENIRTFTSNFAGDPTVRIPKVIDTFSCERVLCMEFLEGVSIREARAQGMDMTVLGDRYLQMAYSMLFEHGLFHGDLHPGNVLILDGEVLGLLDFGMTGRLTREMRDNLVSLIFALERGDFRTVTRVFFDIAIKEDRVDYAAFQRDTIALIQRNWKGHSIEDVQIGTFLMDMAQGAIRHRVRTPACYTMFFKALLTTEGLAKSLLPEVNPILAAKPYVERIVAERYSPQRIKEDLFYNAITLGSLARRLPVTLSQLFDDLDQQRFQLSVRLQEDTQTEKNRDHRQGALIFCLFTVGFCVAGSLALPHAADAGMPYLPKVLFWLALPCFFASGLFAYGARK